jgi:hypothetical protein
MGASGFELTPSAVQKKTEAAGERSLRLPLSPPCDSARVCGRCLSAAKATFEPKGRVTLK